ncbi:glycosyl hydrolase family 18 protein [Desulfosporosinus sp. PR]|uniref:glycosyl hydrolase family 18 protein n=1 Tax=Candidatus Desulfosporosinus nitrosoreducens TaxID=3401928 RepID=UPI0027FF1372|nr:glycosyl hydrolase family 18 protein [Desulfosporosinus sp. PR]MDQ7097136.1 glycosyl hydrolase family 18 protein [Desulfosporosinus sp. PR]
MKIHIVKTGESLWKIARIYGVSLNDIVSANQVPDEDRLVVGQTLVIPSSQKPQQAFSAQENTKPRIDVSAYLDPRITGNLSDRAVDRAGPYLTYLGIFSYAVNPNGSLTPVKDQLPLMAARRNRIAPLLVLTNYSGGQFSKDLAGSIFNNELLQEQILEQALRVMEAKGYAGLDFDFEYLGKENREGYLRFLQRAAAKLKPHGYFLSAAVAPKISGDQKGVLYEGHDYPAIGQIVDFMFIMTYEWGWSGGEPMAVSPLNLVRQVMEYAVSVIPKDKIMMGIPLYGYDWTLPHEPGKWARSISPQQALQRAIQYEVSIHYNKTAQAPWFRYTDVQGRQHEVWFEDARSIQAKFNLVKELGIRGFYYWVLGHEFPQNWLLIEENFTVRKW